MKLSISGQTFTKSDIGLGNVDNTSDANKPISSVTQSLLNLKANTETTFSGVYTPIITVTTNLDEPTTITKSQYMRVGNVVTVYGRFMANATLTAMSTSFEMSLPIASDIISIEDIAGTAVSGLIYGLVAAVVGSVANNTALIRWVSSDVNEGSYAYHFTYSIL